MNDNTKISKISRRDLLKAAGTVSLAATAGCATARRSAPAPFVGAGYSGVPGYLAAHRRWLQLARSGPFPSDAGLCGNSLLSHNQPGAYGQEIAGRICPDHHPFRIKKLERHLKVFQYGQIQSLLWLGEDASSFSEQVRSWGEPFIESTVAVCQYRGEKRVLHANTSFFSCLMRHGAANLPRSY